MNKPMRVVSMPLGMSAAVTFVLAAAGPLQTAFAAETPTVAAATVTGDTLRVSGTDAADAVSLRFDAGANTLSVDFGGAAPAQTFNRAAFTSIAVALGEGADSFIVNAQGQFHDLPLTVDGGDGNDFLRGSDGNDVILGGAGDDDIDGGRGTDTELLGAGTDSALWLPGEASDVIDGGGGHDTLAFVGAAGSETFGITASAGGAVLTRDLGGIRMDMSRVDDVNLAALGGADRVNIGDLSQTSLRSVRIDLSTAAAPDGQLDSVSLEGTDQPDHATVTAQDAVVDVDGLHTSVQVTGNDARDQLHLATGAGNDVVAVTAAAAAAVGVAVDLGADQH